MPFAEKSPVVVISGAPGMKEELDRALCEAERWTKSFCLLEVRLAPLDRSPALDRLAARLARRL
jgi:indolepyruvate decarboxylase